MEKDDFQLVWSNAATLAIPIEVALVRAKLYYENVKNPRLLSTSNLVKTYVLIQGWGVPISRLAGELCVHKSTIYRWYETAKFFYQKRRNFRSACADLCSYILYNAKYIHSESAS